MDNQFYTKVIRLFLAVPQGCLRFVIVVFPDYTHLLSLGGGKLTMTVYLAPVMYFEDNLYPTKCLNIILNGNSKFKN